MKADLLLLIVTVLVALTFDFLNGFHDAANSIATVVSTRVLSPKLAVLWAAIFNFLAAFFLGTAVAKTIGQGMIRISAVTQYVVIAGLIGAIVWDLLTWWWGLPTSSSHALIGGYAGAAIMRSGFLVIIPGGWSKTLIFILIAPVMGLVLGFFLMVVVFWLLRNKEPQRIDTWFRKLQLLSAAAYSLGHGGNDAQKTMGIVATALYGAKYLTPTQLAGDWGRFHWPIILAAHASIAFGTYFGGWRIVHTMGSRITKLKPVGGFCAETAGAITLFSASLAGIPVSTTHDHGSNCWSGRHDPAVSSSVGGCASHRVGVDSYDTCVCFSWCAGILGHTYAQTGCVSSSAIAVTIACSQAVDPHTY